MNTSSSLEVPVEEQLAKHVDFVSEHAVRLQSLESALTDNRVAGLRAMDAGFLALGATANLVDLHNSPDEMVEVMDIVKTENDFFNKTMLVLGVLSDEVEELVERAESHFFPALVLFGTDRQAGAANIGNALLQSSFTSVELPGVGQADKSGGGSINAGNGVNRDNLQKARVEMIGNIIPFLQELANFVGRCNHLVANIVYQLSALFDAREPSWYKSTYNAVALLPVFKILGDILRVLITLDALVMDNAELDDAWQDFKQMMQFVRADPSRFALKNAKRTSEFEEMLMALEAEVMASTMFQNCVEADFNQGAAEASAESTPRIETNTAFLGKLESAVLHSIELAEGTLNTPSEGNSTRLLMNILGLYVLYRNLSPKHERPSDQLYQKIWSLQIQAPVLVVLGKVPLYIPEFLELYAPLPIPPQKLSPSNAITFRSAWLNVLDGVKSTSADAAENQKEFRELLKTSTRPFAAYVDELREAYFSWALAADSILIPVVSLQEPLPVALNRRAKVLLRGVMLAQRIQSLCQKFLCLHLETNSALTTQHVSLVRTCVQLLKAIESVFAGKAQYLMDCNGLMLQQQVSTIVNCFGKMLEKIKATRKFDFTKLDLLAAFDLTQTIQNGSEALTSTRYNLLNFAFSILLIKGQSKVLGKPTLHPEEIRKQMRVLSILRNWQKVVHCSTDCSFLYYHRDSLLGFFFRDAFEKDSPRDLQYLCSAWGDCKTLLTHTQLFLDPGSDVVLQKLLRTEVEDALTSYIIEPCCASIEERLRLAVHSVHLVHMKPLNPLLDGAAGRNSKTSKSGRVANFIRLPPLRMFGRVVSLREAISRKLEQTFYTFTTLHTESWKTYTEMRFLAKQYFGLELQDNFLPMGSLEKGLDVLEIMRHIHTFVRHYNYDANSQTFIEKKADKGGKHLNTINMHSIAQSIKTHGTGMMNTTVNHAYKYLQKQIKVIAQFCRDQYISSRLAKEKRWYRKHTQATQGNNESGRQAPRRSVLNQYPYERAEKVLDFVKGFEEAMENGETLMDKLCERISWVGNALGFVRIVRSAGMNQCGNAAKFIPYMTSRSSSEQVLQRGKDESAGTRTFQSFGFAAGEGGRIGGDTASTDEAKGAEEGAGNASTTEYEDIEGAQLEETTVNAAINLDRVIQNIETNFSDGVDYFDYLVRAFQALILNDEDQPPAFLSNFYMLIPACMLNFAQSIRQAKFRMNKIHRGMSAYFVNDGFTLGVAFMLAVLKQRPNFDSLHWFKTVDAHCKEVRADATDALNKAQMQQQMGQSKKGGRSASRKKVEKTQRRSMEEEDDDNNLLFGSERGDRFGSFGYEDDMDDEEGEKLSVEALKLQHLRSLEMQKEMDLLKFSMVGAFSVFSNWE